MDKAVAQARQVQAQEATAQGVVEIKAQLDRIEAQNAEIIARLDTLLAASNAKPAAVEAKTKKAGA